MKYGRVKRNLSVIDKQRQPGPTANSWNELLRHLRTHGYIHRDDWEAEFAADLEAESELRQ